MELFNGQRLTEISVISVVSEMTEIGAPIYLINFIKQNDPIV